YLHSKVEGLGVNDPAVSVKIPVSVYNLLPEGNKWEQLQHFVIDTAKDHIIGRALDEVERLTRLRMDGEPYKQPFGEYRESSFNDRYKKLCSTYVLLNRGIVSDYTRSVEEELRAEIADEMQSDFDDMKSKLELEYKAKNEALNKRIVDFEASIKERERKLMDIDPWSDYARMTYLKVKGEALKDFEKEKMAFLRNYEVEKENMIDGILELLKWVRFSPIKRRFTWYYVQDALDKFRSVDGLRSKL
ncbi:MAG: hypothetical protein QXL94_08380, partial [Candidatus Parvarchaeum sp.]